MTIPPTGFGSRPGPALRPRAPRFLLGGIGALLLVVVIGPWLASFATDWLWFREIGFQSVFLRSLVARALLFTVAGVLAFIFLYTNFALARRGATGVPVLFMGRGDGVRVDVGPLVIRLLFVVSLVVAFIMAVVASAEWMSVLMALYGAPLGTTDPLLGRDIAFYLFRLPAIAGALTMVATLTALALVGVALIYLLRGAIVLPPRRAAVEDRASRHIGVLVGAVFVVFAVQLWVVDAAGLLFSTTGPLSGASYADAHVSLPGIHLSSLAALGAAGLGGIGTGA